MKSVRLLLLSAALLSISTSVIAADESSYDRELAKKVGADEWA